MPTGLSRVQHLLSALLLCGVAGVGCGGARQAVKLPDAADFDAKQPAVVDEGYRFRLAQPAPGWRLLGSADAGALIPDASAITMDPRTGAQAQVLVEQTDVSLHDAAELHARVLSLRADSRSQTPTRHQGIEALVVRGVREVDGRRHLVRSLMLFSRGHLYELRVVLPLRRTPAEHMDAAFDQAVDAFALLAGPVRGRTAPPPAVADAQGADWRVRDGVYESPAAGLRVKPPRGWRLLLRDELQNINPDASFGLQSTAPAIFLTVIAERVDAAQLPAVRKAVTAQQTVVEGGQQQKLRLGRAPLKLKQVREEGLSDALTLLHGTLYRGERLYQIAFGTAAPHEPRHLQEALDALHFLTPDEEQALVAQLAAAPDPEATATANQALWGGRFRDFERGIVWQKPDREWSVRIGDAAATSAEGAILAFEHARLGLFGWLVPMEAGDLDAQGLLRLFMTGIVSEGRAQQVPLRPLELNADSSATCEIDADVDGLPFRLALLGAVRGDRGLVLMISGYSHNVRAAREQVAAARAGLKLSPPPLARKEETAAGVIDWRIGSRFVPPEGAAPKELALRTRPGMDVRSWAVPERQGLIMLASTVREGRMVRIEDLLRIAIEQQLSRFSAADSAPTPSFAPHPLAGRTGYRASLEDDQGRVDLFAVTRGQQIHMLTVVQTGPGRSAQWAETVAEGFELLD
jgi:hypothetical protein